MEKPAAWVRFIPVLLFAFALALRLVGLTWGLKNDLHNQSYHPDEPVIFLYSQSIEPAKGKFTPGFYNYGTLYLTGLRVIGDVVSGYGGAPDPKSTDSQWTYASRVHLGGRLVSAVAGAFTALLVFLILRRWVSVLAAFMGGLIPAVAPAFVVHSRFQTVDVLATAFLAASTLFALRLIPTESETDVSNRDWLKYAAFAGLFAGLSAGTKYTGILALATLVVAAVSSRRKAWGTGVGIGVLVAAVAFVVTTPGVLLDQAKFLTDFQYEVTHTSTGHGLVFTQTGSGFFYHFANMMVGFGPVITLIGVAGLFMAVGKRERWAIAAFAFFILYYILIGRAEVKFLRYVFPLLIGVGIGFGYLVQQAIENKRFGRYVVCLGIAAIGGIDPGGLRQAAIWTSWMVTEDPRDAAVRYLRSLPDPGRLGLASDPWFYTPPTWPDAGTIRGNFPGRMTAMQEANPPTVYYDNPVGHYDWDTALIDTVKPERISVSSFEFFDILRLKNANLPEGVDKLVVTRGNDFLDKLDKSYTPEIVFGGDYVPVHDIMYIHPNVTIWKRKTTSP